jgi:hypothetical protein
VVPDDDKDAGGDAEDSETPTPEGAEE